MQQKGKLARQTRRVPAMQMQGLECGLLSCLVTTTAGYYHFTAPLLDKKSPPQKGWYLTRQSIKSKPKESPENLVCEGAALKRADRIGIGWAGVLKQESQQGDGQYRSASWFYFFFSIFTLLLLWDFN